MGKYQTNNLVTLFALFVWRQNRLFPSSAKTFNVILKVVVFGLSVYYLRSSLTALCIQQNATI